METDERTLDKIAGFFKFGSALVVFFALYVACYPLFHKVGLWHPAINQVLSNFQDVLQNSLYTKIFALVLLFVGLLGTKGKKDEKINPKKIFAFLTVGLILNDHA